MSAPRFERHMSDADALMWNIEKDPQLRSTIVAVGILERAPDHTALRARFDRASVAIPRLRQRVLSPPLRIGPPRWTYEVGFDLDYHLRRLHIAAPGTHRQLLEAVSHIAQSSFDRARPLWECIVFEGLADGHAAVVLKVHHSVTDGVGGIELLAQLVDLERNAVFADKAPPAPVPEPLSTADLVIDSISHTLRRWMGIGQRIPATAIGEATGLLRDPLGSVRAAAETMRSIGRTLAIATAPMSPLMTERGMGRRLDSFDVGLDDLKRAAKASEASLNDAFVSAVIGGLERYHRHHGVAVHELRMTMPINIRNVGDSTAGNQFAPARFAVPLDLEDPRERMKAVGALVKSWRAEPALGLTGTLAGVLNRLPTSTTTAVFGGMLKCVDFVTSNVPGAPLEVYMAGSRVDRFYAFGPPSGAGVNVTLMSHVDTCCIGIVSDTTAVPDADLLVADLKAAFEEVVALGVEPISHA